MPRPAPDFPRLTLARAVYSFVCLGVLFVGVMIFLIFTARSSALLDSALDRAVRTRTAAAGENLARSLHNDWVDLKFLASAIPESSSQRITGLMDGMRGDANRISWIGFADMNGIVQQASDDLLVGQDVSERPWFRNGARAPFAGDVHEALLLASLLETDDPRGLRFVDLAIPVKDGNGETTGVVAVHINFAWAEALLEEQARTLGLALFLTGTDGSIVVSSQDSNPTPQEVAILRAALPGTENAVREVWPDGETYFSSLVPQVTYGDLPNFGWRMVGRLSGDQFSLGLDWLRTTGIIAVVGLLAVLGTVTAAFVMIFIRPIEEIAARSEEIADGADVYPPDLKRTREAARLSAALTRLQSGRID